MLSIPEMHPCKEIAFGPKLCSNLLTNTTLAPLSPRDSDVFAGQQPAGVRRINHRWSQNVCGFLNLASFAFSVTCVVFFFFFAC